jgi:hypothetical protein
MVGSSASEQINAEIFTIPYDAATPIAVTSWRSF